VLDRVFSELAADLIFALLIVPIPLAVGVAIIRHRLYDIDRLINRTLVYGLLTVLLGAVYAVVVLVLGALFGGITERPASWAVDHPGRGRPVPARPPPHPGGGRSPFQPSQVQRRQDC
jgi:hypothetical protein